MANRSAIIKNTLRIEGVDTASKAVNSAKKSLKGLQDSVKKKTDAVNSSSKASGKWFDQMGIGALKFNMIAEAASKVFNAVGQVGQAMKEAALTSAQVENAFGSFEKGMEKLAATGDAMSIKTFAKFHNTLKNTGIELKLTQAQVKKLGALSASMGLESDRGFELFAEAIAKGESSALEQLGLFEKMEIEIKRVALEQGRSAESFKMGERQTIMLNMATRQLNEAVVEGGRAFSQIDQASRNFTNSMEALKVRALNPLAEYLSSNINILFEQFGTTVAKTGISIERSLVGVKKRLESIGISMDQHATQSKQMAATAQGFRDRLILLTNEDQLVKQLIESREKGIKTLQKVAKFNQQAAALEAQKKKAQSDLGGLYVDSLHKEMRIRSQIHQMRLRQSAELKSVTGDQEITPATANAYKKVYEAIGVGAVNPVAAFTERVLTMTTDKVRETMQRHGAEARRLADSQKVEQEKMRLVDQKRATIQKRLNSLSEQDRKIAEGRADAEKLTAALTVDRIRLMQIVAKMTRDEAKNQISILRTTIQIMESDRKMFGARMHGIGSIKSAKSALFRMERKSQIANAKAQIATIAARIGELNIQRSQVLVLGQQAYLQAMILGQTEKAAKAHIRTAKQFTGITSAIMKGSFSIGLLQEQIAALSKPLKSGALPRLAGGGKTKGRVTLPTGITEKFQLEQIKAQVAAKREQTTQDKIDLALYALKIKQIDIITEREKALATIKKANLKDTTLATEQEAIARRRLATEQFIYEEKVAKIQAESRKKGLESLTKSGSFLKAILATAGDINKDQRAKMVAATQEFNSSMMSMSMEMNQNLTSAHSMMVKNAEGELVSVANTGTKATLIVGAALQSTSVVVKQLIDNQGKLKEGMITALGASLSAFFEHEHERSAWMAGVVMLDAIAATVRSGNYAFLALGAAAAAGYGALAGVQYSKYKEESAAKAKAGAAKAASVKPIRAAAGAAGSGTVTYVFNAPVIGGSAQEISAQMSSMQDDGRGSGFAGGGI